MKERIREFLKSDDIEMVRLGAVLLEKLPRHEWKPMLEECNKVRVEEQTYPYIYTTQLSQPVINTPNYVWNIPTSAGTQTWTTASTNVWMNTPNIKWRYILHKKSIEIFDTDLWMDSMDIKERSKIVREYIRDYKQRPIKREKKHYKPSRGNS